MKFRGCDDMCMRRPGRSLALVGLLVLSACTATSNSSAPPPKSAPPALLQAAPRYCPRGPERAAPVPADQTVSAMGGHIPTAFPATGFGLVSAWSLSMGLLDQSWATWTDESCRTVTVNFYPHQDGGPNSWRVQYDKQKACGNSVMGMGECIGYRVALPARGGLSVQTIGLSRPDADQLVQSIPL